MLRKNVLVVLLSLFVLGLSSVKANCEGYEGDLLKKTAQKVIAGAETDVEKAEKIYYFIRDEIKFGWLFPQAIPVEEVLKNKKGVCMQKANLLVAMARKAGLKARFHFMYVRKNALEDFLPGFAYKMWLNPFIHTFPEIYLNGKWISMEATFDKELHEICIKKKINFGKYKEIVEDVSIEFSPDGVKGHQQYVRAGEMESFYGDDLFEFLEYLHADVPWWKKMFQPMIFRKAQKIMDELRDGTKD